MNLPYEQADQILAGMTLEQKIGQMVMASIEVTELDDKTRRFLRENHVGNIILFGKNCIDRAQLAKLNQQIQDEVTRYTGGVQALLSIDQEGGNVTRIRNGATVFGCAMSVGRTMDPENAYLTGHIMGNEMRELGIYFDLAPVLDSCSYEAVNPVVGRRSYGKTPEDVALMGGAMARGLQDAGILACGKHFPGSGDCKVDTHFAFAVEMTPEKVIREQYLIPFRKAIADGLGALMTSHICYPALEPGKLPATMSKRILRDLVRDELGFDGLVISDGLQMLAIAETYGAPNGCVRAAQAGCDLLIVGNGGDNADPDGADVQTPCIQAMLRAVETGELSMERVNESARRVIAHKLALGDMQPNPDVVSRDWRAHEAFAAALAEMAVKVERDDAHMLPLPKGALFLSRVSRARLGVEEGDHLVAGFAPMAARLMDGEAVEFADHPDLDALKEKIQSAPAVVFAFANASERDALMEDMKQVCEMNAKACIICLDIPLMAEGMTFAKTLITSHDQTVHAIRAICKALQAP